MECVQQPLAKPNPSHYSNPDASQSLSPTSGVSPSKAVWGVEQVGFDDAHPEEGSSRQCSAERDMGVSSAWA